MPLFRKSTFTSIIFLMISKAKALRLIAEGKLSQALDGLVLPLLKGDKMSFSEDELLFIVLRGRLKMASAFLVKELIPYENFDAVVHNISLRTIGALNSDYYLPPLPCHPRLEAS